MTFLSSEICCHHFISNLKPQRTVFVMMTIVSVQLFVFKATNSHPAELSTTTMIPLVIVAGSAKDIKWAFNMTSAHWHLWFDIDLLPSKPYKLTPCRFQLFSCSHIYHFETSTPVDGTVFCTVQGILYDTILDAKALHIAPYLTSILRMLMEMIPPISATMESTMAVRKNRTRHGLSEAPPTQPIRPEKKKAKPRPITT